MESLRAHLGSLSPLEQVEFAKRCGTSIGYLRKVLSTQQRLGIEIAIGIERESSGSVRAEDLRPDVDWQYLRNSDRGAVA